jgi:protease II
MRDDNWQAMFKDPSLLDPAIRVHLEAENFYQQAAMADTEELRKTLFAEMRGRIKEDDSSVPSPDGAWLYGVRYVTGGEQPKYFAFRAAAATSRSRSMAIMRPRASPISASPEPVIRPITRQ